MLPPVCVGWFGSFASSILQCFLWIFRSLVSFCARTSCLLCLSAWEGRAERGGRRERAVVFNSCRRVVRFLYLRFDDGPRPSEYGTCCGLGWFCFATPTHVASDLRVGICCCSGGLGDRPGLAAAASSWLAWIGRGGSSCIGSAFVLFLRRMKFAAE